MSAEEKPFDAEWPIIPDSPIIPDEKSEAGLLMLIVQPESANPPINIRAAIEMLPLTNMYVTLLPFLWESTVSSLLALG